MIKNRYLVDHPAFGEFISGEINRLHINRESFRSACHMNSNYVNDIKKGSTIMR